MIINVNVYNGRFVGAQNNGLKFWIDRIDLDVLNFKSVSSFKISMYGSVDILPSTVGYDNDKRMMLSFYSTATDNQIFDKVVDEFLRIERREGVRLESTDIAFYAKQAVLTIREAIENLDNYEIRAAT